MPPAFKDWELAVLQIAQDQLPYSATPYDDIAKMVGVSPEAVLGLLSRLRDSGVIRRFGASIRHQRSGWSHNAMTAWIATPEQAEECGPIAARFPAISHVYYRPSPGPEWPYSFYTMMHGRSEEDIETLVKELLALWPLTQYEILPTVRELKKISMTYFKTPAAAPSKE